MYVRYFWRFVMNSFNVPIIDNHSLNCRTKLVTTSSWRDIRAGSATDNDVKLPLLHPRAHISFPFDSSVCEFSPLHCRGHFHFNIARSEVAFDSESHFTAYCMHLLSTSCEKWLLLMSRWHPSHDWLSPRYVFLPFNSGPSNLINWESMERHFNELRIILLTDSTG